MKNIFLLLAILFTLNVFAQNTLQRCAFDEVNAIKAQNNPVYKEAVISSFNNAREYALKNFNKRSNEDILRIPVVVHVVYKTASQNISDSLIFSQIEVLNRDFRRYNADTANTRSVFDGIGKDGGIEFYLACTDPDGNATNGITRTETTKDAFTINFLTGGGLDDVKFDSLNGKSAWNTSEYLNIWVCNTVDPQSFFGAVLGFAYPPVGSPNWDSQAYPTDSRIEGVVAHYQVFGKNNPEAVGDYAIANQGRTAVHEVGHYLGLRHIWGDGQGAIFGGVDCNADDGISDTPNAGNNSQTTGCNANKNTCNEGAGDKPDMWENYMDYSDEVCQTIFTSEQVDIMRANLSTLRSALLTAKCAASTAVAEKNNVLKASIYPNPTSEKLNISLAKAENITVKLINTLGVIVFNYTSSTNGSMHVIDINHVAKGIYFANIVANDKSTTKRLIITE
jgi:hypothetical protein